MIHYFLAIFLVISTVCAAPSLSSKEKDQILVKVQAYLNKLTTLQAKIQQTNPNGTHSSGELWLKRPGRMKISYKQPKPLLMVANLEKLTIDEDGQVNEVYTDTTPAVFLLRETIDLKKDLKVQHIERINGHIAVSVSQLNDETTGLTLMFQESPKFQLIGWTVIDGSGNFIPVKLTNVQEGVDIPNQEFKWKKTG